MSDTIILNVAELRKKWAIDQMAEAVSELMDRLETIEDDQTVESVARLFQAINIYIREVKRV